MRNHLPASQLSYHKSRRWTIWMSLAVVSLLAVTLLSTPVLAAKRIAFVVGISKYDHFGEHQQLDNPVHDAQAMAKTLGKLGFEVIEGIDLPRSEFYAKWQKILDKTTSEDTLVFFYSGHGVEVDGQNLLLPRDIPYFKFGRHAQFTHNSIIVSELLADGLGIVSRQK